MTRSRPLLTAVIAAVILFSGGFLGAAPAAFAQAVSSCDGFGQQGDLQKMKSALQDMSTNDPIVIDRNLQHYTEVVAHWRQFTPGEDNAAVRVYGDALEFWREKKARLETGGTVEVRAGGRWTSYLRSAIDKAEKRIVGTWNWWNGYTVTFNENGGASYMGSSLVRSGVGTWQNTSGNSYHVHWLKSNTNDYFTLSYDGMKLEGTYDGKPGVSTRKC